MHHSLYYLASCYRSSC